jgi:hypothetical protein
MVGAAVGLLSERRSSLHPRLSLCAYPIYRCEMGLENINLFNRPIRPFGFDRPMLAVTQYHTEDWRWCNDGHATSISAFSDLCKADGLPQLMLSWGGSYPPTHILLPGPNPPRANRLQWSHALGRVLDSIRWRSSDSCHSCCGFLAFRVLVWRMMHCAGRPSDLKKSVRLLIAPNLLWRQCE